VTEPYTARGSVGTRRNGTGRADEPEEPVDTEAENEIGQWLQTTVDNKEDLANTVNEQLLIEFTSIRTVAVEEEAKKTIAAIEGLMLSRQQRFEEFTIKIEEARQRQALRMQTQEQSTRGTTRGRTSQGSRTRGRTTRGDTTGQGQW